MGGLSLGILILYGLLSRLMTSGSIPVTSHIFRENLTMLFVQCQLAPKLIKRRGKIALAVQPGAQAGFSEHNPGEDKFAMKS